MKFLSILALAAAVSAVALPNDDWNKWQSCAKETQYVTVTKVPEKQIEYQTKYETKYGTLISDSAPIVLRLTLSRNQDSREASHRIQDRDQDWYVSVSVTQKQCI